MFEDFLWALWLTAAGVYPLGFMLGSSCSPCCGPQGCGVSDGKARTDPKNEGTWTPSGTWTGVGGVTWTFTANPGDESGETWFFYGSSTTSKVGGGATTAEQRDWGNICNWYSNKTTSPSSTSSLTTVLNKRATRLPPTTAVVHVYSNVNTTTVGPQTVKNAYFWNAANFLDASELTVTAGAHDSAGGCVFATACDNLAGSVINGGATFNGTGINSGSGTTVNGGATFNGTSRNTGSGAVVNGGAAFNGTARNESLAVVNDGATFNGGSLNLGATVNGGATFNDNTVNELGATVNDGAVFNDSAVNQGSGTVVNGGATFNGSSANAGVAVVNGGATFNDSAFNTLFATVNGGATFNDTACSSRSVGSFFATPCTRKFVVHPTDLPTCNGTAPDGCANAADTCGCG